MVVDSLVEEEDAERMRRTRRTESVVVNDPVIVQQWYSRVVSQAHSPYSSFVSAVSPF